MGYTHYWTFAKPKGVKADALEAAYQRAVKACNKVIHAYQSQFDRGDDRRLSGYSAHSKTYGGINVNGSGDNGHETFALREHFNQNFETDVHDRYGTVRNGSSFCKTARKPYDTVVTACLSILKYYLKDAISVSSDGNRADWAEGVLLARLTLRRAVPNPIPEPIAQTCSACGK